MLVEGVTRQTIQSLAQAALTAANTLAGSSVFEPRSWPAKPGELPMILVQTPRERKVSLGPNIPQFNSTISLAVVGRVANTVEAQVNADLDTLSAQIEDAILAAPAILSVVQQFLTVESQSVVTSEGKFFVGEVGFIFDVEVYQVYGPNTGTKLTDIRGTITSLTNGDTLTVADAPLGGFVFGESEFGSSSF